MTCRARLIAVAASFACVVALGNEVHAASGRFPMPASLRPAVEFWTSIFAVYSEHQVVIHDSEHLGRVYSVLDYRDRAAAGESLVVLDVLRQQGVEREKARIRKVLLGLHARQGNSGGLDAEERRIWGLFAGDTSARRFAAAAERIRSQRGLKERFGEGVRISRRYLAEMEEIFRQEGLPTELTRLPLVESCFDLNAYSKVGAAGIWQFMPATGKAYLRISGVIDERRDPLRATRGAARHLKENYAALGTWPLAITAYNHGRGGMRRAVKTLGTTDIGRIVHGYRGPLFGFASRNFYAEFLAALAVEREHRKYFGDLTFELPFTSDEVLLDRALSGQAAASCAALEPDQLAALNPAVDRSVFARNGQLPSGYRLRVPPGTAAAFQQRLAGVPREAPRVASSAPPRASARGGHKVERGQTLSHIARRYGVSVASLQRANGLRGSTVRAGQVLRIPSGAQVASYRTHKVQRGQTLSHIARRYRVSVRRIQSANRLRTTMVRAGQVLRIPSG